MCPYERTDLHRGTLPVSVGGAVSTVKLVLVEELSCPPILAARIFTRYWILPVSSSPLIARYLDPVCLMSVHGRIECPDGSCTATYWLKLPMHYIYFYDVVKRFK